MLEGVGGGEPGGIFDEEKNAADFVERGDGASGNDREFWSERGNRDEAEIGGTGVELGCAGGRRGVVDVVLSAQGSGRGLVFEVVEQWRRVEKSDGGDAQGHLSILEEERDTEILRGMI